MVCANLLCGHVLCCCYHVLRVDFNEYRVLQLVFRYVPHSGGLPVLGVLSILLVFIEILVFDFSVAGIA